MTLETRIIALASAIGADVKALRQVGGNLASLNTTAKTNLVAAINELHTQIAAGVEIDDTAAAGNVTKTWSADKIISSIIAAQQQVKDDLIAGAGSAYDTLKELADLIQNNGSLAAELTNQVAKRVRFDEAQSLTSTEQATARGNIGAASAASVTTLSTAIGDTDHDFVSDYTTAVNAA